MTTLGHVQSLPTMLFVFSIVCSRWIVGSGGVFRAGKGDKKWRFALVCRSR